ncbi:hypothetical protein KBA41_03295, partial [Candidatus Ozemobacteraceae bacterium]|nr:hypothetical protein [Candidatus Ozemobacteraceae bacterium]
MKDSLKLFMGLLLLGQLFLIGAISEEGAKTSESVENVVVAMAPIASEAIPLVGPKQGMKAPKPAAAPQHEKTLRKPATILNVTHRADEPYQALDFDFSGPISFQVPTRLGKLLRVRVSPPLTPIVPEMERGISALFESFRYFSAPTYTELVFAGKGAFGDPVLATGTGGLPRLTLLFRGEEGEFPLSAGDLLAPGVTYYTDRPSTKAGLTDAHIIRVDPLAKNLAIFPVLANEGICQKEILSSMAKRYKAIAGI